MKVEKELEALQQTLIGLANSNKDYNDVVDNIYKRRKEKQQLQMEITEQENGRERLKQIGSGFGGLYYNKHKSEEEFGVELGIAAMKYTLITENYDLTDNMKARLDTAFGNFLERKNECASNYVKEMQQDPFVRDKEAYAVDWKRE